ncbi:hypothetical protein [Pseudoscardovia suis]|nr:hypothetical protein [Pseudoscardovia suis]
MTLFPSNCPSMRATQTAHAAPSVAMPPLALSPHSGVDPDGAALRAAAIPTAMDNGGDSRQHADILVFGSANAGCGVSVTAACCARMLAQEGARCALVDVDFEAGGLDVTLGVEDAPGLRWNAITTPLGRMDPEALMRELVDWDGVALLASDCRQTQVPPWWNVTAALDALAQCCDVVIVDAGRGGIARALKRGGLGGVSSGANGAPQALGVNSALGMPRANRANMMSGANVAAAVTGAAVDRSRQAALSPPPPPSLPRGVRTLDGTRAESGARAGRGIQAGPEARVESAREIRCAESDVWLVDPALSDTQLSGTRSSVSGAEKSQVAVADLVPDAGLAQRNLESAGGLRVREIQLVELSVLGLARAQAWHECRRRDARDVRTASVDECASALCGVTSRVLVGVVPAASKAMRPDLGARDAEAYLNEPVLGPLPRSRRLCAAVLAGEGVGEVPRKLAAVLRRALHEVGVDDAQR